MNWWRTCQACGCESDELVHSYPPGFASERARSSPRLCGLCYEAEEAAGVVRLCFPRPYDQYSDDNRNWTIRHPNDLVTLDMVLRTFKRREPRAYERIGSEALAEFLTPPSATACCRWAELQVDPTRARVALLAEPCAACRPRLDALTRERNAEVVSRLAARVAACRPAQDAPAGGVMARPAPARGAQPATVTSSMPAGPDGHRIHVSRSRPPSLHHPAGCPGDEMCALASAWRDGRWRAPAEPGVYACELRGGALVTGRRVDRKAVQTVLDQLKSSARQQPPRQPEVAQRLVSTPAPARRGGRRGGR